MASSGSTSVNVYTRSRFHAYPALKRIKLFERKPRVPVVLQLTSAECGVACLAMVLGFFGREVSVDALREACGVSRDGLSGLQIIRAADALALRGRGVRIEPEQLALLQPGATILHWQLSHWVVFAGLGKDHVTIHDPGIGRRKVPFAEFRKAFTGVALTFEPTADLKKEKRQGLLFRTVKEVVLSTGLLPRLIVTSLVLQTFGMAMPLLVGQLIDRVLPRADAHLLHLLMAGMFIIVAFRALGEFLRAQLLLHLKTLLDVRMSFGFLDRLARLPYSYFQARGTADLMQRAQSNSALGEKLTASALSTVLDGVLVVVYVVVLLLGNAPMALAALCAGAIDMFIYVFMRRQHLELTAQSLVFETKSSACSLDILNSIETLKASGAEERALARWSNAFVDSLNVHIAHSKLTMKAGVWMDVLRQAGPLAILLVGASQCLDGKLSIGAMLGLQAVASEVLGPIAGLISTAMSLDVMRTHLDRVNDVLKAEPEQHAESRRPAPRLRGRICLEHVTFRYGKEGAPAVDDVSLELGAGEFIAIVGASGSGKSTLAKLLLGLYPLASGRITYDGHDLAELELRSLRRQLGVVGQDPTLMSGSVRENIALAEPELSLTEVTAAAQLACIHDDIAAMPLGYQTLLVDGGSTLSGGQRQRIALARALAGRASVLLLDEATSALDAKTEARVHASLASLRCTRIVIAHRLSTIREADKIVVMHQGRVVEVGSHHELCAKGGAYADLVATQLGAPKRPRIVRSTVTDDDEVTQVQHRAGA